MSTGRRESRAGECDGESEELEAHYDWINGVHRRECLDHGGDGFEDLGLFVGLKQSSE